MDLIGLMTLIAQGVPDPITPPGLSGAADTLLGWVRWAVPVAAIGATMVGLSMWAIGSSGSDYQQVSRAKKTVAAGALVGIVSGVLPTVWGAIVNAGGV